LDGNAEARQQGTHWIVHSWSVGRRYLISFVCGRPLCTSSASVVPLRRPAFFIWLLFLAMSPCARASSL
jgi:hypothetical protein